MKKSDAAIEAETTVSVEIRQDNKRLDQNSFWINYLAGNWSPLLWFWIRCSEQDIKILHINIQYCISQVSSVFSKLYMIYIISLKLFDAVVWKVA